MNFSEKDLEQALVQLYHENSEHKESTKREESKEEQDKEVFEKAERAYLARKIIQPSEVKEIKIFSFKSLL